MLAAIAFASFTNGAPVARSAYRDYTYPGYRFAYDGFRVARTYP